MRDAKDVAKENSYYILPTLPVGCFIKRPVLMRQLKERSIRTEGTKCPVVVLLGMGGQGKSQLTMEFCRLGRLVGEFKAIFWIDATSNASLDRSFENIIARISNSIRVFDSIASKGAFVKDTIEGWSFPWLLVFDNYDQPDEVFRISNSFPQSGFGSIIVTSRHASSKRLGNVIQVTGMSENESLELFFLRSEIKRTNENISEAKPIVAQLGYLPLAIDQAGAYISAQGLSTLLFATHYKERKAHILRYTPSLTEYRKRLNDSDAETALNVFTTLELSLQGLGGSDKTREAFEDFLTLSAFFNNTSIGEDLNRIAAIDNQASWISLFTSENVWDHYKYQDGLANLNHLSLLQSLSPGDLVSFSLHPLVSDWLKLRRDRPSCRVYTIQSCSALTRLIDVQDPDAIQLGSRQYLLAHIESCVNNQCSYLDTLDYENEVVLGQLSSFASFLGDNARYREAEELYQRALQGYEKTLGADHTWTLRTVNHLGLMYSDQGRLKEAEEMYQRALQGREKALGPDHTLTLNIVNNIGSLYRQKGGLKEAEKMYQRALQGYEKALGADHTWTLDIVNNLGLLYSDQGRLKEAEEMYQRALQGSEKALGADHTSTLNTVNNLGNLYRDQGRLKEAEEMYQWALQGYEKSLGADHTSTLDTVNNLGNLYADKGRLKEAEEMYQRALQGCEKALGADHTSTLRTVNNLGFLYSDQGRLKEAEEMYQQALQGYEKALGADHTLTLDTVNNLGGLYSDKGRLKEAEEMYQRALQGYEKALRADHTSTLRTVNNLGNLYRDQGRLKEAEEMYQRALQGYEKALGADHTSTLDTVNNLGNLYADKGRLKEAEEMYQRALQGYEKALGVDHPSTAKIANNLSRLTKSQPRRKKRDILRRLF